MTIGIENLPNQKHRRSSKRGCHLTLMTVGPSGVGKTTFINTLFTTSLCTHRDVENRFTKEETSKIKITEADLEEKGFRLKLSLIDTPGFGDRVNNAASWAPIVEYIDAQYSTFLNQEMRADRTGMSDSRVHACLYFIEPNGHGLKPLDVTAMKELGNRVNLIPVIAKADTITLDEMASFKSKIRDQLEKHDIRIYRPPVQSDDEEATKRNAEIATAIPFSVIGSEETITVGGQPIRGRQYTWGVAEVENDKHCDFKKLRSLLLRTHLLDLIVTTEETHYENFRDSKLVAGGLTADMTPEKLARQLDLKIKEQEEAIKKKLSEQVKQEDQRFKTWSEKLAGDRDRLNKEIETMRKDVEDLKNVVKNLQDQRTAQTAGKKK